MSMQVPIGVLLILGVLGLSSVRGGQSAESNVSLPSVVREGLERNASGLSPLSLTWERRRAGANPTVKLRRDRVEPYEVRYTWQDGKFYAMTTFRSVRKDKSIQVNYAECSFDLQHRYLGTGQELPVAQGAWPVVTVDPIDRLRDEKQAKSVRTDYFRAAGFHLPESPAEFGGPAKSLLLSMIEQGARVTAVTQGMVEKTPCDVIRLVSADRECRFYLDPALAYAVRRQEELSGDNQMDLRSTNDDFIQLRRSGAYRLQRRRSANEPFVLTRTRRLC